MPSGVKATLMPSGSRKRPSQPFVDVDRGEGDAGHRGGQREGQVDQRVHDAAAGEAVADQHPGDEEAEHRVDRGAAPADAPKLSR